MRVLVVEDDARLAAAVVQGLQEEGWLVDHASDGTEARLFVRTRAYDVIVLDRLLPDTTGDALLVEWRADRLGTPVLLLTALDTVRDRVAGLRAGADDYLGKPFAFPELVARVEALARRAERPLVTLTAGALRLDPVGRTLTADQRTVTLTAREYALMELFFRHQGQVLTREQLAGAAWHEPWDASDNLIEVHIRNIRRKLALVAGNSWCIRTVRLAGYVFAQGEGEPC